MAGDPWAEFEDVNPTVSTEDSQGDPWAEFEDVSVPKLKSLPKDERSFEDWARDRYTNPEDQQIAREEKEKINPVSRALAAALEGVGSGARDISSLAQRPLGTADDANRIGQDIEQGQAQDAVSRNVRGITRSLTSALPAAKVGGVGGLIGFQGASEANQSLTRGADAGLEGSDLYKYAAARGLNEAAVTAAFSFGGRILSSVPGLKRLIPKAGTGGFESIVTEGLKTPAGKSAVAELAKTYGAELAEELVILGIGEAIDQNYGTAPKDETREGFLSRMGQAAIDTGIQTAGMVGGVQAINSAAQALDRSAELSDPVPTQQFDGYAVKDGMLVPEGEQNAPPVQSTPQPVVGDNPEPQADAQEQPETQPEQVAKPMTWDELLAKRERAQAFIEGNPNRKKATAVAKQSIEEIDTELARRQQALQSFPDEKIDQMLSETPDGSPTQQRLLGEKQRRENEPAGDLDKPGSYESDGPAAGSVWEIVGVIEDRGFDVYPKTKGELKKLIENISIASGYKNDFLIEQAIRGSRKRRAILEQLSQEEGSPQQQKAQQELEKVQGKRLFQKPEVTQEATPEVAQPAAELPPTEQFDTVSNQVPDKSPVIMSGAKSVTVGQKLPDVKVDDQGGVAIGQTLSDFIAQGGLETTGDGTVNGITPQQPKKKLGQKAQPAQQTDEPWKAGYRSFFGSEPVVKPAATKREVAITGKMQRFGVTPVFVQGKTVGAMTWFGGGKDGANVVLVDSDFAENAPDEAVDMMIGDEVAHAIGLDKDADIIASFTEADIKAAEEMYFNAAVPAYQKVLQENPERLRQEAIASFVSKFFQSPSFQDRVFNDNKPLWKRLAESILKFFNVNPKALDGLTPQQQVVLSKLREAVKFNLKPADRGENKAFAKAFEEAFDTRGKGVQYHGTKGKIGNLSEGYYNDKNIYGGEGTFYTTDAFDIARGYRRKSKDGTVYEVQEKEPVKFFDMEQKLPVAEVMGLFGDDRNGLVEMAVSSVSKDGTASLRDVMDEFRDQSKSEGLTRDDVQEYFSSVTYNLGNQGYGGMSHVGGAITGKNPHTVKIYFDPANQISVEEVSKPKQLGQKPQEPIEPAPKKKLFQRSPEEKERTAEPVRTSAESVQRGEYPGKSGVEAKPQATKEPWQMTREEFESYKPKQGTVSLPADEQFWEDLGEGPFNSEEEAEDFRESEVGAAESRTKRRGLKWVVQVKQTESPDVDSLVADKAEIPKSQLEQELEQELLSTVRSRGIESQEAKDARSNLDRVRGKREYAQRDKSHRLYVQAAIRDGKPVPPEVLADYPDLEPSPEIDTVSKPPGTGGDKNIGREWDSPYGRQRIVSFSGVGSPMYSVETVGSGDIRNYSANRIEDVIRRNEYELTPEYKAEVEEGKAIAADRAAARKVREEKEAKVKAEIAEFTAGKPAIEAGRMSKTLMLTVKYNGNVKTRKQMIEGVVDGGAKVVSASEGRRLEKPDGSFLSESTTTKIGMNYAKWLIARKTKDGGEAENPQLASPFRKQQSTWKKSILQKKFPTKPVSERGQTALPGMSEDAERAESKLAETAVFRKYRQQIARYDAPLEDGSSWADSVVDQLVSARELIAKNRELYDYPSFSDVWEGEMPNHPGRDTHAEDSAQTIFVEFVESEIERLTPDIGEKIKSVMQKPLDENEPLDDLRTRLKSLLDGPESIVNDYEGSIENSDTPQDIIDEAIDGLTDGYRAKGFKEVLKSYIPAIKEAEAAASKRRDEAEAEAGRKEQEEYERLQAEKEVKRKAEAERKAEPASEDADTPLVRGDVVLYGRREARVAIPDLGNLSWKKGNLRIEMTNGPDKGKLVEVERQDVRKLPYEETEAGKAKADSDRKATKEMEAMRKLEENLIAEIVPVVRKAKKAGVDLAPKTKKATKELISNISLATNISNESLIKEAIDRVLASPAEAEAESPKAGSPEKQRLAAALGKEWADHYGDAFLDFYNKFSTLPEKQKDLEYRGNQTRREFQTEEGAAVTYAGRMTGLTEDGMRLALRAMKEPAQQQSKWNDGDVREWEDVASEVTDSAKNDPNVPEDATIKQGGKDWGARFMESDQFKLMEIPISKIDAKLRDDKVPGRSKTKGPIVIDRKRGRRDSDPMVAILDGQHRVAEAIQRGDKTIKAWVGDKITDLMADKPEPQSFDRQTPRKGTPEREAIDKKHSDARKVEDELSEESSRLRAELRKVKSGTKKESQLQKKYDAVQEKMRTAGDRENEKTRRIAMHEDAVDEAKDEWLRYIAIDRLNSLFSSLDIKRRIPNEGSYERLKDAAGKEARRLGVDKDRAEQIGQDTAQEMFAFGKDTMKDTVAKRVMIDGEEKPYRDAIKELRATDVSGKSDIERNLDNYRRDPDKINEIMQGVRREVANEKKAKEMADAMISDAVKERSARAYPLSEVKATVANVLPNNILPVGADYISDGRFAIKKSAINPKKAKAMLGRTANEGASVEVANKQFVDLFEDKPQGDFEFVGVVDREIIYKKKEITIPAAIYVDENGDVKFVDARFVKYLEGDYDQVAKADNNRILFLKDGKPIAVMQGIDAENSIDVAIAKKAVADKTPAEPAPKKRIGRKKKDSDKPEVAKLTSGSSQLPGGDGLNPNYRGPKDTEPGVSFQQLKDTWTRIFGTPIRLSYFNAKGAMGIYKYFFGKTVDVARLSTHEASSAAVAAHEIAHGIDKKHKITYGNTLSPSIINELVGWDHSQQNKPEEGVAEYMRFRLLHPDGEAEARFPQFHPWFENWLGKHPDIRKKLDEGRKFGRQYASQPEYQRFAANIGNAGDDLSPQERWKKMGLDAVGEGDRLYFDALRPWKTITDFLKERGDFSDRLTPEEVVRNYAGTVGHRAEDALQNGPESIVSNERFGKGLYDIKGMLKTPGEQQESYQYAWARHVLFMADKSPDWNGGMTVEQAKMIVDNTKAEAGQVYEKVAEALSEYGFSLLKVEVDAGMKTQAEYDTIREYYGDGKFYLPMERNHPDAKGGTGAGTGLANIQSPTRRRGGGADLPPKDFLEQLYVKTHRTYKRVMDWKSMDHLLRTVDPLLDKNAVEGAGWIAERIDPKSKKSEIVIERIIDQLVDKEIIDEDTADDLKTAHKILSGVNMKKATLERFANRHNIDPADDDALEAIASAMPDITDTVDVWDKNLTDDPQRAIIAHRSNGKIFLYQTDRAFYDLAIAAPTEISSPFKTLIGGLGTLSSRAVTTWNPAFLLANPIIDWLDYNPKYAKGMGFTKALEMLATYAVWKAGKAEQSLAGTKTIKAFTDWMRGGDTSNSALFDLFDSSGGKLFSGYSPGKASGRIRRKLGIKAESLYEQGQRLWDGFLETIPYVEEFSAITDAPIRLAEMDGVAREMGFYAKGDKWYSTETDQEVSLPEYAKVRILNAGAEATTNFKKRGAGIRNISWAMPLVGAQLAGVRKEGEYAINLKNLGKDTPEGRQAAKTLIKYAGIIATTAALFFARKDDDDWKESDDKYDNWLLYGDKGKTVFKVPMPRNTGGTLAGLTVALLDAVYNKGEGGKTPGEFMVSEAAQRLPTGGGIVKTALETFANWSTFRNRKIVSDYMGQRAPRAQFDSSTVELSKVIGRTFNISPIQFQYFVDGTTGSMYSRTMETVERRLGWRPESLTKDLGVSRFLPNRHQQRSLNDFYDELGSVGMELKGQRAELKEGRIKELDPEVVKRSKHLSLYEDMISDLGKEPDKDQYKGYMVGLAREALGYPELKDNKNPLYDKDAPEPVKAIMRKFMKDKVESVMLAYDIPTKTQPGDASWEESLKKWEAGHDADMKWIEDHKTSPYIAQAIADTKRKPSFRDRLHRERPPQPKGHGKPC